MHRNFVFSTLILFALLSYTVPAQPHASHCNGDSSTTGSASHGGYHYPGDTLQPITAAGTVLVTQDSLQHMPHYSLDTNSDGVAEYWLHFGPRWYQPDSIAYPTHGTQVTVSGGLIEHTAPKGIMVLTLNGQQWIDTSRSYDGGSHHGNDLGCGDSTHLYYDTLQQVQHTGTFLVAVDTLFGHDEYYLDTDNDGAANFWLHLGHPGYIPDGLTLPNHGQSISVTGAFMPHSTPPGIMVLTIDGELWRDSTWTGGHGGGWVGRHGGHISTSNGSWCLFPDSAWGRRMGGHMGGMRWSDSVYCRIDTAVPAHWNGGSAVGYRFIVDGSDGRTRMGHGHGGMMNFNLATTLSLRYREGFFPDEDQIALWKSDGEEWHRVQDASIDSETNTVTANQNPLYLYYVIAESSPTSTGAVPASKSFRLEPGYPNPFRNSSVVTFAVDHTMYVRLAVYDLNGRLVQTLVDGHRSAGQHSLVFRAGDLPSGNYLLRMDTPSGSRLQRLQINR